MTDLYEVKRLASLLIDAINHKNECRAEDEFNASLTVETAMDDIRDVLWPERKAWREVLKSFAAVISDEPETHRTTTPDDKFFFAPTWSQNVVTWGDLRMAVRVLHGEEKDADN